MNIIRMAIYVHQPLLNLNGVERAKGSRRWLSVPWLHKRKVGCGLLQGRQDTVHLEGTTQRVPVLQIARKAFETSLHIWTCEALFKRSGEFVERKMPGSKLKSVMLCGITANMLASCSCAMRRFTMSSLVPGSWGWVAGCRVSPMDAC